MTFKSLASDFFAKFKPSKRSKFTSYGLPFLLLVLGGSFGLKEFAQIRYQFSKTKSLTKLEAEKLNEKKKKESVTLEEEYEKIKDIDIDNWENKRGPRPWEMNAKT